MKQKKSQPRPFLNRYTSLPVLLDMLVHKKIVLLKPSSWEDKNDSYYMERYREERNLETLVAICFTKKRETFHHWKIFTNGASGVSTTATEYTCALRTARIRYPG